MTILLYITICLIWGSTWLAIKIGLVGVPPFLGAGLRFVIATAVFGVMLLARRKRIRLSRDDRISVLSVGLLLFWLDYAGVYWAETRISSGLAAILFSTMPLFTALLARYWTRSESLDGMKIAGIIIGTLGTALLFGAPQQIELPQILAMVAVLGAALCAAINLVTLQQRSRLTDSLVLNCLGMGLGSACLLTTSLVFESRLSVSWTLSNVLALLYLSAAGSVVAFLAYHALIKRMAASSVSYTTLVIPIVALGLGRLFLKEAITGTSITGTAVILGGIGLATRRRRKV